MTKKRKVSSIDEKLDKILNIVEKIPPITPKLAMIGEGAKVVKKVKKKKRKKKINHYKVKKRKGKEKEYELF